ncbi:hypothetical protein [Microbacterium paludicola]|uniref:hypothetical protein n=1 Tax=Microbacterium paludicola TaxID=300019 RepID=UPI0031DE1838
MFAPLRLPFEPPAVETWNLPPEPPAVVLTDTPMLRLPAIALATLRYTAPPVDDILPTAWGRVTEAACRLALWREWAANGGASAFHLAENLQSVYWPRSKRLITGTPRYRLLQATPRRGYDLLRLIDERTAAGLQIHVDMPDGSTRGYTTMRLSDALAMLQKQVSNICDRPLPR